MRRQRFKFINVGAVRKRVLRPSYRCSTGLRLWCPRCPLWGGTGQIWDWGWGCLEGAGVAVVVVIEKGRQEEGRLESNKNKSRDF